MRSAGFSIAVMHTGGLHGGHLLRSRDGHLPDADIRIRWRATAWNPKLNMFGTFALALSGSTLYAVGIAAFGATP